VRRLRAIDARVFQGEQTVEEVEVADAGGGRRVYWEVKTPIYAEAGDRQVCGLLGISTDITAQKRAETALRESEEKFSRMFKSSPVAITLSTLAEGRYLDANEEFLRLLQRPREEVVGRTALELEVWGDPEQRGAIIRKIKEQGSVRNVELEIRTRSGQVRRILWSAEKLVVGGEDWLLGSSQDITERRQLEGHLRQAQKMEAIGTLAGGIAHDFNNILAIILGSCHLLEQDTEGNARVQESVRDLFQAANRARDLVQQILAFSRQSEHKRQIIRLDTVLKEAAKFLRASLPAQIKIETDLAADAPAVLADPTQIYQVVMNLATNALHAMEDQPGRLTVGLDSFLPDENFLQGHPSFRPVRYARLTVADTGRGMDARTLERIFEPFFTTKPVGKGTGLGLAVVHGIVQSHQGVITVDSQPGAGATFRLHFPAQSPPEIPAAASGRPQRGQGQKILLVDDEPALTAIYQQVMRRLNYQVTTCNSARASVDLFRADPGQFDLVITDLTMPEMNGLEVARQIRALRPEVPVVLSSGQGHNLTEADLQEAGVRELLNKPVSLPALAELVHRLLTNSKPGGPGGGASASQTS
jgi:PAS domain S-box-containing protein